MPKTSKNFEIKIGGLASTQNKFEVSISAIIKANLKTYRLWFSLPIRYRHYITETKYDAFVISILPLAMKNGCDIRIDGPISELLFYNLTNHYIDRLASADPEFKVIRLLPSALDDGSAYSSEGGVACAFSGGVDSFHTLLKSLQPQMPHHYRVTHLIFTNVGSHGTSEEVQARRLFKRRLELIKPIADELSLKLIYVDSNLHGLLRGLSFVKTHTIRNTSAPLLLQQLLSKFYYSSGLPFIAQGVRHLPVPSHAYLDSQTVHLLSTELCRAILFGAEYSRGEKIEYISSFGVAQRNLNVCVKDTAMGYNCSRCQKCMQTMLALEACKMLENFRAIFDLEKYYSGRRKFVTKLLLGKKSDVLNRELLQYLNEKRLHFPRWYYVLGMCYGLFFKLELLAKSVRNSILAFMKRGNTWPN